LHFGNLEGGCVAVFFDLVEDALVLLQLQVLQLSVPGDRKRLHPSIREVSQLGLREAIMFGYLLIVLLHHLFFTGFAEVGEDFLDIGRVSVFGGRFYVV